MNELRPAKNYIPAIDGLRALSIFLVICHHCSLFKGTILNDSLPFYFLDKMGVGVSCFFVISGFLITGILFDTKEHPNYYKNFFFRRVLRIFPLYYLVLFIAFVIVPRIDHPMLEKFSETDPTLYWLYLSNFYIAAKGGFSNGLVDLSWSLSIEEQFYLIWPWFVLLLSPKNLVRACFGGILISIFSRYFLYENGASFVSIYVYTFCRLDGLLFGSLLALAMRDQLNLKPLLNRTKLLMPIAFLIFLFFTFNQSPTVQAVNVVIGYSVVALFFGLFTQKLVDKKSSFFENKALISIGKYSYGIYLIHNPVQSILRHYYFKKIEVTEHSVGLYLNQLLFIGLTLAISYGLAWLVFNIYEVQFLKLKKYFSY